MSAGQPLIDKALAKLEDLYAEVASTKTFINQICKFEDRPLMFEDVGEPQPGQSAAKNGLGLAPDEFVRKPLASCVRRVLEVRKTSGGTGPATADEIYEGLKRGGYEFPSKDAENQRLGLQVSLSKNSVTFRRLQNGLWGLAEWYGPVQKAKKRQPEQVAGDADGATAEQPSEAPELASEVRPNPFE